MAGLTGERELVDGVPDYMESTLHNWLTTVLRRAGVETSLRLRLRRDFWIYPLRGRPEFPHDEELLELVDAALHVNEHLTQNGGGRSVADVHNWTLHVKELQFRLWEAGSAWQVNSDFTGLERRLDETVQAVAKQVMDGAPADAATHLKAAWVAAYGFHPDPEKAYSQAVKAAEAVIIPATIPRDGAPTLGKALKNMQDTAAKWTVVLHDKAGAPASAEPVIGLIKLLWEGQRDRHAGGPTTKPTTQEEAEAAVHMAITLVQWFQSKAVVKTP